MSDREDNRTDNDDVAERLGGKKAYGYGTLYRRGKVIWLQYSHNGVAARISLATTDPQVARRKQRELYRQRQTGEFLPVTRRLTVADLIDDLVAHLKHVKPDRAYNWKYASILRVAFGHIKVSQFRPQMAASFAETLVAAGRARATVDKYLRFLAQAFKLGYNATPQTVARVPKIVLYHVDNVRTGLVTPALWANRIRPAIAAIDQHVGDFFDWFFCLGWRPGMVTEATWDMVNTRGANGAWVLTIPGKWTKSGHPQLVSLPEGSEARVILERRLALRRLDSPLIFWQVAKKGSKHRQAGAVCAISKNRWYTVFRLALQKAGLGNVGLIPYDLRRSVISDMLAAGKPIHEVMAVSGHKSLTSFIRYAHALQDATGRVMIDTQRFRAQNPGDDKAPAVPARKPRPAPTVTKAYVMDMAAEKGVSIAKEG